MLHGLVANGLWTGTVHGVHSQEGGPHRLLQNVGLWMWDSPQTRSSLWQGIKHLKHVGPLPDCFGGEVGVALITCGAILEKSPLWSFKTSGPPRPCGYQHTRRGLGYFSAFPVLSGLLGSSCLGPQPSDPRLSTDCDLCFPPKPWIIPFLCVNYFCHWDYKSLPLTSPVLGTMSSGDLEAYWCHVGLTPRTGSRPPLWVTRMRTNH